MHFSLQAVRDVARLLHETELAEITVEDIDSASGEPVRMVLKRTAPPARPQRSAVSNPRASSAGVSATQGESGSAAITTTAPDESSAPATPTSVTVTSTAVGLFRHPTPPLKVGDAIKKNQVVAIVESLKIPNEIVAKTAGRVDTILADDGQGVEYGQPLLTITTDAGA